MCAGNGRIILALLAVAIGLMIAGVVARRLRAKPEPKKRKPVYALTNLKRIAEEDELENAIVSMQQLEPTVEVRSLLL